MPSGPCFTAVAFVLLLGVIFRRTFEESDEASLMGDNRCQFPAIASPGSECGIEQRFADLDALRIEIISQAKLHAILPCCQIGPQCCSVAHLAMLHAAHTSGSVRERLKDCLAVCLFQDEDARRMRKAKLYMIMEKLSDKRAQHSALLVAHHTPETAFPLLWRSPVLYRRGAEIAWKVRLTDESGTSELFLQRTKESPAIVAIGLLSGSCIQL